MAIHNEFKKWTLEQVAAQDVKVILLADTFTEDVEAQNFYSDIIAHEISADNYTAGGQSLANMTVTKRDGADDDARLTADPTTWANPDGTITAAFVGYIINTGNAANSAVISTWSLGGTKTRTNEDFVLTHPANILEQN